jgi:colicin import membrane protein
MKTILFTLCCTIGLISFGQPQGKGKEKQPVQKEEKGNKPEGKGKPESPGKPDQSEKGNKKEDTGKPQIPGGKPEVTRKPEQKGGKPDGVGKPEQKGGKPEGVGNSNQKERPESKPANGQGNAYGKNKGDLSGREFGQQRAAEARAKHEEVKPASLPELQKERDILRDRNVTLVREIDQKIEQAKGKLNELQKTGTITKEVYQEKMKALEGMVERKQTVELKIGK